MALRKNTNNLNIFSMSALDLFASALGAFIVITLMLMPYYLQTDRSMRLEIQQLEQQLTSTTEQLASCNDDRDACNIDLKQQLAELSQLQLKARQNSNALAQCLPKQQQCLAEQQTCKRDLQQCQQSLQQTFLAIIIQWSSKDHDIDLHVVDPAGAEFFYSQKTVAGRPGELSADTTNGPGVEVWEIPLADPGEYKVFYKYYADHGNTAAATVSGGYYHRDGHEAFREVVLRAVNEKPLIGVITVTTTGDTRFSSSL